MRVIVVGAGVVGLTCAVRLAEAGYDVDVLARDLPLETTSAVAAALWYPYKAEPPDRVLGWSATGYAELARLADTAPASGVRMLRGVELLREVQPPPWWASAAPGLDHVPAAELPAGYLDGWTMIAPVVDMSVYLPWLANRLAAAGGTLTRSWLTALPEAPVVVNCTGLAARALADDPTVVPVRGQVVHVEQFGLDRWVLDDTDPLRPTYVIPRERVVVVGGTTDEGSYDPTPDPDTAAALLERAAVLVPQVADARVVAHRVGLRPVRPSVRLEAVRRPDGGVLIHCYGHGGAGVTLAPGCAAEVVQLVATSVPVG